jgi:DAK2 domain fusion protein YloV
MKPVEGTILTVARAAASAARRAASAGGQIKEVLASALAEAKAALARTPELLPVLAEAGVVDAGGQGFTIILEGILRYISGESFGEAPSEKAVLQRARAPEGKFNYDTQFIIQGTNLDVESIREQVARMGDSVLVVGDAQTVKVHVHTDNPGKVIEYGTGLGQLTAVIVENMQLQYEDFKREANVQVPTSKPVSAVLTNTSSAPVNEVATVAVVSGNGLQRVFESLGVSAIVPGGQTMNPSTQDLLSAINNVAGDKVILLPNNSNVILTAQQAKELASKQVFIVPTRTIPQGIAALLAYNYQASLEANLGLMTEASTQIQTGEITRAVRSVQVNGLSIAEGQIIGLVNGELVAVGTDISMVMAALLEHMGAENYEIITIYYGEEVTPEEAAQEAQRIKQRYPNLDVEVLNGGQAHYYYIISAE